VANLLGRALLGIKGGGPVGQLPQVAAQRSLAWIYDHHLDWDAPLELDAATASA
jgi:hypothetical protein